MTSVAKGLSAVADSLPGKRRGHQSAMPPLELSLQFADPRHRQLLPRYKVARWLRAALDPEEVTGGAFAVRIVGAQEGQELNREYRHKDYATNVLTFDYDHGPQVEADLVICAEVVEREANEQNKTVEEHYAHMLVHGALHAQGWDHMEPKEAEAMEARERLVMARLGFADPYA